MPRDSEVEKLKSRIGQLENEKNDLIKQLHTKNDDLTRHENFTTSELDSLKKKEETLKTELNRERQRRQELATGSQYNCSNFCLFSRKTIEEIGF